MSKMPGRWTHVHTQQLDSEMPLQRYLLWVGGALLALLFAANSLLPPPVSNDLINSRARLPMVRIHSELKGPQAVVIDTNTAAVVPNSGCRERHRSGTDGDPVRMDTEAGSCAFKRALAVAGRFRRKEGRRPAANTPKGRSRASQAKAAIDPPSGTGAT